jgi:hypothetical protein
MLRGSVVFVFEMTVVSSYSVVRLVHKRSPPSWILWMNPTGLTRLSHCIVVTREVALEVAVRTCMAHGRNDGQAVVFR